MDEMTGFDELAQFNKTAMTKMSADFDLSNGMN